MPRTPEQFEEIREKTKQKILEHSLRLFAEKGYHGTSISDIAKSAGISKGLAYNYFESKQQLVESILEQILEFSVKYEEMFDQIDDPYEQLKFAINYTFDNLEENEEFWRLYISLALQPSVMETSKKILHSFVEGVIGLLAKIFKEIGVPNPKAEAYILGGLFDGVSFGYIFDKENYRMKSVKKKVLEKYSKEGLNKLIK